LLVFWAYYTGRIFFYEFAQCDQHVSAFAKAEQQRRSEREQQDKGLEHQRLLATKYKVALHETESPAAVAAFASDSGLVSPGAVLRKASLQSPPREAGVVHQRTPFRGSGNGRPKGVAQGARSAVLLLVPITRRCFPRTCGSRRRAQHQL
jgi:hypothetical protein